MCIRHIFELPAAAAETFWGLSNCQRSDTEQRSQADGFPASGIAANKTPLPEKYAGYPNGNSYPFTAPAVTPAINCFCKAIYIISSGSVAIRIPANMVG